LDIIEQQMDLDNDTIRSVDPLVLVAYEMTRHCRRAAGGACVRSDSYAVFCRLWYYRETHTSQVHV